MEMLSSVPRLCRPTREIGLGARLDQRPVAQEKGMRTTYNQIQLNRSVYTYITSPLISLYALLLILRLCQVIGNQRPEFIEKRRVELEKYLQNAYEILRAKMPREFVEFLHFDEYDRTFLLQKMAHQFATHIDHIAETKRYAFSILEMHAISRRLSLPCHPQELTTNLYNFSHVLDFCSHLERIIVVPTKYSKMDALHCEDLESFGNISGHTVSPIGTSNIVPANLHFNLNAFRNLRGLTLLGVPPSHIESLGECCQWTKHKVGV